MNRLVTMLTLAVLAMASLSAFAEEAPVKCLMMGMGPHGENTMDDVLRDIAENYPSVAITASENVDDLKLENLKNYDVLMMNQITVEGANPPDFAKEGILEFLKQGGGLVVTHFAVANVQEWRDSIDIYGAMWVNGKSTHDAYHEFSLDIVDEAHPIVEGVKPFTTNDELYFNLLMRPDMHVIMTADQERFGHTVAEPMLTTHYVHNARCVYFALGHDVASNQPPQVRQIIVQSIEWAACRR